MRYIKQQTSQHSSGFRHSDQDACVVLSFFNPCNFSLPKQHFHTVVNTLHASGIPLVVTQAVFPGGQPERVPSCITQQSFPVESYLFYKENLWNAAYHLTDAKKLIFLDADVVFSKPNWFERTVEQLDEYDIIQPFQMALWQTETGEIGGIKNASAEAIERGLSPQLGQFHPGFGWAFNRAVFEEIGGWYDVIATGNTDAAFSFCFSDSADTQGLVKWFFGQQDPVVGSPGYLEYRNNILAKKYRVGYLRDNDVVHLWHGDNANRQYISRKDLFPRNPDHSYPVVRRNDKIIEWQQPDLMNDGPIRYFFDKQDDGVKPN